MNQMQVKTFLSVMRTRNLTVSARELYLSQQAVSKHIITLERELNLTLFTRQKGCMAPTEAALFYNMIFTRWQTNLARVQRETQTLYDELRAHFKIGIAHHIDLFGLFETQFQSFRSSFPNTQFSGCQHTNITLFEMLDRGDLDVVLMSSRQLALNNRYNTAHIARERICLHAPMWVGGDSIDPNCWGLPLYAVSEGHWDYFENPVPNQAGRPRQTFTPPTTIYMPNFQTIRAKFAVTPGVVLCDQIFGPMAPADCRAFPLNFESYVLCLWSKRNEHPMIPEFIQHMQLQNGISSISPLPPAF